ncbi:hypothetical protein MNB_SV-5-1820 [hydrothermal vent metagenome]|uniref:L,D-TPase catalytic domain-containing protein n=1 Tax=hydrothermal vent metagenome TaxID=652676 RepID=A0A1W1EE22_9ZZZZ
MRLILLGISIFLTFLSADEEKHRELIPFSKTEFTYIDKAGNETDIDMTGKEFIFVSVREENSDGRFYAVDKDGTVWLSGGISSGEEIGFTPSGKWKVLRKIRFYTSKTYPEEDGSNNMDYSLFFTKWGHALHKGSINNTSHGCIHVEENDIRRLFAWAKLGTPVFISRHRYIQFARPDLKRIYLTEKQYRRAKRR